MPRRPAIKNGNKRKKNVTVRDVKNGPMSQAKAIVINFILKKRHFLARATDGNE